jgi:hypothetical protein
MAKPTPTTNGSTESSREVRRARYELEFLRSLIGDIDEALSSMGKASSAVSDEAHGGVLPSAVRAKLENSVSNAKSVRSALKGRLSKVEQKLAQQP